MCITETITKTKPFVSYEEVTRHNKPDDLWILVDNKVYDVTKWFKYHPGGETILRMMAGKDCTEPFLSNHPAEVMQLMPRFHVANIKDRRSSEFDKDFTALKERFQREGLFNNRVSYWAMKLAIQFTMLAVAVALVVYTESTWVHMCAAVLLGLFWQQFAFVGHDICHNGVTGIRKLDYGFAVTVGTLFGGISSGWWKSTHNVHHVVCNSLEYDPDIQHLPLIAVNSKILGSFFSHYHNRQFDFDRLARIFVSYQHILYYPIMAVARFNLYIQSYIHVFKSTRMEYRRTEFFFMVGFACWVIALLFQLNSIPEAIAFLFLSHAVAGLLHVQITLSHFPRPVYSGLAYKDAATFFSTQLNGTMDVDTSMLTDWFHGGLQYQIEHHLFPRMPRHNLRLIKPVVREFCKRHGVEYTSMSFWDANCLMLRGLRDVARLAQASKLPDSEYKKSLSFLAESVNAAG